MSFIDIYKALADESRLRIVHLLGSGYFNVQELTSILELGQSTVSHHLKVLHQAEITKLRREGTWAFYALNDDPLSSFAPSIVNNFLEELSKATNGSLPDIFIKDKNTVNKILEKRRESSHKYFETIAKEWKNIRQDAQGQEPYLSEIISRIPSDKTFLELGCGTGVLLEKLLPRTGTTIGVDYSKAMLDEAGASLKEFASNIDLRLGNLEHIPIRDNSIDIAIAYMVFHHIATPAEVLKDTSRVVREGGELLILDLCKHSDESMRDKFADLWLGFEASELAAQAEDNGFSSAKIEFFGTRNEVFLLTCIK